MITLAEVSGLIEKELRGKLPEGITITEDTRLDALGLSSLQVSEIVFSLEEAHDVEFDAADAADVATLGQLIDVGNRTLAAAR